jgi:hypothetical protein
MSVFTSVVQSVRAKTFLSALSVLTVIGATFLGANVASADSIQVQSYQRASQTEACAARPGETPWQANWGTDSSWKPSWEQWANNGKGGWVCSRSITWAKTPVPTGSSSSGGSVSVTYRVGDVGPGGGLVFLISGGKTYEMAPKAWGVNESVGIPWCSNMTSIPGTFFLVGTGSANTDAMLAGTPAACTSGAAVVARAYPGGGFNDWFLPSQDEWNAMCNYSRNPSSPALPSVGCTGSQDPTFAGGLYGFAISNFWSSSQSDADHARIQVWNGPQSDGWKGGDRQVRPIRAF